jgi:hypothetical protein
MTVGEILKLRAIRVRLNSDLNRYHPDLRVGVEGTTRFAEAKWGVWCNFPGAGQWDIIPSGLDILDEEYLAAVEADRAKQKAQLKTNPQFFTSYRKLHLVVDLIFNDNDWDTYVMACGRTAKAGSSSGIVGPNDKWCPACKAEYDRLVKAGELPDRSWEAYVREQQAKE